MRNFEEWINQFKFSISGYDYYVDFKKVYDNVKNIKIELKILESLVGSENIEAEFDEILKKYPEVMKCIPILLAVRSNEIYAQDDEGEFIYNFKEINYSTEQYKVFMRKTGIFELLSKHLLNNLYDYVTGVETGLDSNGRKNRGGHQFENLVERYICKAGFEKDKNYFKEMYLSDVEEKWNVDLSSLSNKGKTRKRFDYVVKGNENIYLIECNFYGGKAGGSKLNETARSYKMLAEEVKNIPNVKFVWFTDGTAWHSARNNLRETFEILEDMYNISDMDNDIMVRLFK